MDKNTARTLAKAQGAKLQSVDVATDWAIFPTEKKLLEFRAQVPFLTCYTGGKPGRGFDLVIYFDELRQPEPELPTQIVGPMTRVNLSLEVMRTAEEIGIDETIRAVRMAFSALSIAREKAEVKAYPVGLATPFLSDIRWIVDELEEIEASAEHLTLQEARDTMPRAAAQGEGSR